MRYAVAAVLALAFAPAAFADDRALAASELRATHLVYARGLSPPEPVVAPGRAGVLRVVGLQGQRRPAPAVAYRYTVAVEGGLRIEPRAAAETIERVLSDPRGWAASGRRFVRVANGAVDFRVALASPSLTDSLCVGLATLGRYSCATSTTAVLNAWRWRLGAAAYGDALAAYRTYMVNHEVGHLLGHGHLSCPGAGRLAPVMVQQTKGVAPCRPNPWPFPRSRG